MTEPLPTLPAWIDGRRGWDLVNDRGLFIRRHSLRRVRSGDREVYVCPAGRHAEIFRFGEHTFWAECEKIVVALSAKQVVIDVAGDGRILTTTDPTKATFRFADEADRLARYLQMRGMEHATAVPASELAN